MSSAAPLAVVLPWYGPATAGGAEAHARQLVAALRAAGAPVEVWTTTARDARAPVAPFYPAGWSEDDGVAVRRFPATVGALPALVRAQPRRFALGRFAINELQLLASLTSSDELLAALDAERTTRRWLFFLYPFPTTFFGAHIAAERAALIPCLHDEPYARYATSRELLRSAPLILANSQPEAELIAALSGRTAPTVVAGEGIDLTWQGDGAAFRRAHGLDGPLIFYVGRRDHSKIFRCSPPTSRASGPSTARGRSSSSPAPTCCRCRRRCGRGSTIWALPTRPPSTPPTPPPTCSACPRCGKASRWR